MKKVLVVDDDDLVRPTVSAMLSALNFEVVEAPNGKEALQFVSEADFNLILTDLFMPEFDGLELILKIREGASDTPIILMTGGGKYFPSGSEGLNDLTSSAEFFGASFVINKPFRKAELAEIVDQALL
jgi:CheY-like chemotaxis protein